MFLTINCHVTFQGELKWSRFINTLGHKTNKGDNNLLDFTFFILQQFTITCIFSLTRITDLSIKKSLIPLERHVFLDELSVTAQAQLLGLETKSVFKA